MNLGVFGENGERAAKRYLRCNGFSILECNYSSRFGEIDIIAENTCFTVFVEVKTRGVSRIAEPAESVTRDKQQKIMKTALFWMSAHEDMKQARFDVIEVEHSGASYRVINHIENAFGE